MQPGSSTQRKNTGSGSTIWSGRGISHEPVTNTRSFLPVRRAAGCLPGPAGSAPASVRDAAPVSPSASPDAGEIIDSDAREAEAELFQRLKAVRTSVARESGVPPYVVFADRSLMEMARTRPCDRAHFATIPGVGSVKQAKYGPIFLDAIRAYCSEPAD